MNIRVEGTDHTRKMIGNIVSDLQKRKPQKRHIDYYATLDKGFKHSALLTNENSGIVRNVSILYLNGTRNSLVEPIKNKKPFNLKNFLADAIFSYIQPWRIEAAIGNKTGNILIDKKPKFMSIETACSKISEFLEQLQPENIAKAKKIVPKTENYNFDFAESNLDALFDGFRIHESINGYDGGSSKECFEAYKSL